MMEKIYHKLQELETTRNKDNSDDLEENDLRDSGLQGITLRSYQLEGVNWLLQRWRSGHGAILGDEMGLGKTCQTVSFATHLLGSGLIGGPVLVISPLSVISNWQDEFKRFSPSLEVVTYIGIKEERQKLRRKLSRDSSFNILLSTYEICMKDVEFLEKIQWSVLVVDEAHRLKNSNSILYQTLRELKISHRFLLTGTPVQNNLSELYSLLSFVAPRVFRISSCQAFIEEFQDITDDNSKTILHNLLKPFLLRRTKNEVILDLPKKSEVLLFHGLSSLQKKMYKAVLTKDLSTFQELQGSTKTSLMNVLMQLRKCVSHPYLFNGVEPEPFELGDHLIDVSGKLHLLDQLLTFLWQHSHKVLLFSQMTHMLDILQDYLGYRGYSYERLDGSVRGEERFLAVKNFNKTEETFVFLLSTKAGGQGLNLVGADTVIFVDSDFNPQNDIQAAARAHRIGQTRPVKVIRLVGKDTVEEIILRRADMKLKLTNRVIEGGQFSSITNANNNTLNHVQLSDMLKFGLEKLLQSEDSTINNVDLQGILGATVNGEWTLPEDSRAIEGSIQEEEEEDMEVDEQQDHIYMFEGKDYSKETSQADQDAYNKLVAEEVKGQDESVNAPRSRRQAGSSTALRELTTTTRKRRELTEEEKAERKKKRQEAAAKRAKLQEEAEIRRAQERRQKLEDLWKRNNYTSCNIDLDSDGDEDEIQQGELLGDEESDAQRLDISYVRGDVTHPDCKDGDAIVVHCVDDSGYWGQGGLFTALSNRSQSPEIQYELAGSMKDLALGDTHLVPMDDRVSRDGGRDFVALIIAQHRDRNNSVSGIKLTALDQGLMRIFKMAKEKKASVHLPRIGHSTPGFNWYGTERLIKKRLSNRGIQTTVYYYPRKSFKKQLPSKKQRASSSDGEDSPSTSAAVSSAQKKAQHGDSLEKNPGTSSSSAARKEQGKPQASDRIQVSSSDEDDGPGRTSTRSPAEKRTVRSPSMAARKAVGAREGDGQGEQSKATERIQVSSSDEEEDGPGPGMTATRSPAQMRTGPVSAAHRADGPREGNEQGKQPKATECIQVSSSDEDDGPGRASARSVARARTGGVPSTPVSKVAGRGKEDSGGALTSGGIEVSSSDEDDDGQKKTAAPSAAQKRTGRGDYLSKRSPARGNKQGKKPQTSGEIQVSSSDDDDLSTSTAGPPAKKKSRKCESDWTGLEERFKGIRAHLDQSLSEAERKKLQRYIVAYDGEVETKLSENTTHVVVNKEPSQSLDLAAYPNIKLVTSKWIWDSIARKKILDESAYQPS